MIKNFLSIIRKEVYWSVLARATLALLPIIVGYVATHNFIFWNLGLITISLGVGAERLKLGARAIIVHFLIILICFTVLFFAFLKPYIFVITCALMAFATIFFTRFGSQIRSLANYTFIPTVYLTCELHEKIVPHLSLYTYKNFILLTPIALFAVLAVYGKKWRHKLLHGVEFGEPAIVWMPPAVAIFLGVLTASSLVIFLHISRGEWVIWSVASVITLGFSSARKKFNDRMIGALVGVPLGLFAAHFAPKSEITYVIAALGIMLTLVSFKRYRLAFGCRCFLVAFAAFIASSTTIIAVERIANVFLGGLIGLLAVYLTELIFFPQIIKR